MAIAVDPKIVPYYDVTFVLGALVFCNDCNREIEYRSEYPEFTDEHYYDAAVAMETAGWIVVVESFDAYCPACAARRRLSADVVP